MACSIVAKKFNIKVAHVEAGIRSGDMSMPEEINRIVTDSISDLFFTTSTYANDNLIKCGVPKEKIFLVGNTMIDTLVKNLPRIVKPSFWELLHLFEKGYHVVTLHRPSNVDDAKKLKNCLDNISNSDPSRKFIFPVHPRTFIKINETGIKYDNIHYVEPMSYLEFIYLLKHAICVVTDSGGITEEASFLNIPTLTLRANTERPETVEYGSNVLIANNYRLLADYIEKINTCGWKESKKIPFWDGNTGNRIINILLS